MRRDHSLDPATVARVEVTVPPMVYGLVGREPSPDLAPGAARLCLGYLVAYALYHGRVDLDTYRSEHLSDRRTFDLAKRVEIRPDSNPDPNAFNPQTIRVVLEDGASFERTMTASLGSPERPLDADGLSEKFESNLAAVGRAEMAGPIRRRVEAILDQQDVTELFDLL